MIIDAFPRKFMTLQRLLTPYFYPITLNNLMGIIFLITVSTLLKPKCLLLLKVFYYYKMYKVCSYYEMVFLKMIESKK